MIIHDLLEKASEVFGKHERRKNPHGLYLLFEKRLSQLTSTLNQYREGHVRQDTQEAFCHLLRTYNELIVSEHISSDLIWYLQEFIKLTELLDKSLHLLIWDLQINFTIDLREDLTIFLEDLRLENSSSNQILERKVLEILATSARRELFGKEILVYEVSPARLNYSARIPELDLDKLREIVLRCTPLKEAIALSGIEEILKYNDASSPHIPKSTFAHIGKSAETRHRRQPTVEARSDIHKKEQVAVSDAETIVVGGNKKGAPPGFFTTRVTEDSSSSPSIDSQSLGLELFSFSSSS